MSKSVKALSVLILLAVFYVTPVLAFDKIDISQETKGNNPLDNSDMQGAKSLMWDIVKFLSIIFGLSLIINAISSGISLNISGFCHSLQIRAHGIYGLFIVVGSIIGVLFALWVGFYLWNNYLVNL